MEDIDFISKYESQITFTQQRSTVVSGYANYSNAYSNNSGGSYTNSSYSNSSYSNYSNSS